MTKNILDFFVFCLLLGHLSASCSLPVGRVPYLLAVSCSDGKVRFWKCNVSGTQPSTMDNLVYEWEEWPLLIEETLPSSSAVSVPGHPIKVSCCHAGRFAVAYKKIPSSPLNSHGPIASPPTLASSPYGHYNSNSTHLHPVLTVQHSPNLSPRHNSANVREPLVHIGIFQCESTGGSQWILEQTIVLDSIGPTFSYGISSSTAGTAEIHSNMDVSIHNEHCLGSSKGLVHLDWVSQENGSHILTVGIGTKIFMYGCVSGKPLELCLPSDSSKDQRSSHLVLLRSVDLVSSVEGSLPIPVSLSWVRDGILVVGMDCEMHVYSQWQPRALTKPSGTVAQDNDISSSVSSIVSAVKQIKEEGPSHGAPVSSLTLPKRAVTRSMMSLAQKLSGKRTAYDLPVVKEDSGLFEAAQLLFPTLPQYHPVQLLELMDLGKVSQKSIVFFY